MDERIKYGAMVTTIFLLVFTLSFLFLISVPWVFGALSINAQKADRWLCANAIQENYWKCREDFKDDRHD